MRAQHMLLTPTVAAVAAATGICYSSPLANAFISSDCSGPSSSYYKYRQTAALSALPRKRRVSTTVATDLDDGESQIASSLPSIDSVDDSELFHSIISKNLLKQKTAQQHGIKKQKRFPKFDTLMEAQQQHGMPWNSSIDKSAEINEEDGLMYMKFWEWQVDFMEKHLTDLSVHECNNVATGRDFSLNVNEQKKARIVSICASSKEYQKIRMTYYDAGDTTQVYNSVFYPSSEYNLPILGIDLLAFNRKKYLAIVDFQPIHDDESDHSTTYEHLLQPIKDKYETLKGRMSSKFYDETKHFSKQMLFARFEDEEIVDRDLFPAFQEYVSTHLGLIRSTERHPENVSMVNDQIAKYDTYSAERDPATGLFAAMYGKEWAEDFVHNFLFDRSTGPSSTDKHSSSSPGIGGVGGGGNPFASKGGSASSRRP